MFYQVDVNLTSVPLMVVGLLALLIWALSLSLDPRRSQDRALLRTYRLLMLLNATVMGLYFVGVNAWLETVTVSRALLALVAAFPPIVIVFVRRLNRRPVRPPETVLWVISVALIGLSLFDMGWFVRAATETGLGLKMLQPGQWFAPYATLVLLGLIFSLREIARHGPQNDASRPRELTLAGVILIAFSGADFANLLLGLGLPPLAWVGSLAITMAFSSAIVREYRNAFQALEVIERERSDLQARLARDELTGLFSRAHGTERLQQALSGGGACVVFIDLDDFKSWNDRFGHAVGDRVLREVARVVRTSARAEDVAARYAGDEFFVVLPSARLEAGLRVAEAIRRNLSDLEVQFERVTASFGVARGGPSDSAASVIDRADRAAYKAKRDGKNRVEHPTLTKT